MQTQALSKTYGKGVNYAPLQPLISLQETNKPVEHYLTKFLKEVRDEKIMEDSDPWRETLEMGRIISNLESGKLMIKRDPLFHELILVAPPKKTNNRRQIPVFQFYMSNLTATWCNSQPAIDPVIEGDDDRADLTVESVKQVHNYYERVIFNEKYNQREAKSALTWGTYITRFGYNDMLRQLKMLKPIVENKSMTLYEGYGACTQCGHEGTDKEFQTKDALPMCPKCGDTEPLMDESLEINANVVTGHEPMVVGDIGGDLLQFPACRFNIRKPPEESESFIYEQYLPIRLLKGLVGDIQIAEDEPTGDENYGHLILEALATRGGTVEGLGSDRLYGNYSGFKHNALVTEMWLKPEMYADVRIQGDERTVSGRSLPTGSKLIEAFPNGLCAVGINNFETVLAIYPENHADCIVSGQYHMQAAGLGKGVSDAIDVYKDMNLLHSKAMAYIERFATPAYGYIKDTVTEELAQQIGDPTMNIPFDLSQVPSHINNINQLVMPLMSGTPNQALFLYAQQLNNMLQFAFQATEFSEGLPGVSNKTATGAQITRDNARKQSIPALKLKAEHRKDSAKVIMKHFKKMPAPRWFVNQDRFGVVKGKYVAGADIQSHITWEVVSNSEVPQNEFDSRQDAMELFSMTGGLPGFAQFAQMFPRFAGWAAKKYKTDIPITTEDEIGKVCRRRIDSITKEVQRADQLIEVANSVIQLQPDLAEVAKEIVENMSYPLAITETGHTEKGAWLSEFLDADEVAENSPLFRECIQKLIENHFKCTILQQYKLQELAMEVQAALAEQQAEAMAPMVAEERGYQEQQANAQFEQQQATDQAKNEQTMVQEGINVAKGDRAHAQAMEMEKTKQAGAMALQKAQPRPATAK